ncbi:hypothetical protein F4778DRAFT_777047 [Xylariomycetidae sp. FL2044]|nr:hypothetical protein F4778DRAFT_777047 [Xylariomycetidae sp. FL2044]
MSSQQFLRDCLPRAGLRFPENGPRLLSSQRRENKVLMALRDGNVLPSGLITKQRAKQLVGGALAEMMQLAQSEELIAFLRRRSLAELVQNTRDLLVHLKQQVAWASALSNSIFFELFGLLVKARGEWREHPLPPFNVVDHCQLAVEIDAFQEKAGSLFTGAELDLWGLVGGFGDDDDDDYEYEEEEDENENEDEDKDEEMGGMGGEGDGEAAVEEAREMMEEMDLDD